MFSLLSIYLLRIVYTIDLFTADCLYYLSIHCGLSCGLFAETGSALFKERELRETFKKRLKMGRSSASKLNSFLLTTLDNLGRLYVNLSTACGGMGWGREDFKLCVYGCVGLCEFHVMCTVCVSDSNLNIGTHCGQHGQKEVITQLNSLQMRASKLLTKSPILNRVLNKIKPGSVKINKMKMPFMMMVTRWIVGDCESSSSSSRGSSSRSSSSRSSSSRSSSSRSSSSSSSSSSRSSDSCKRMSILYQFFSKECSYFANNDLFVSYVSIDRKTFKTFWLHAEPTE